MIDQGRIHLAIVEPDATFAKTLVEALSADPATELVAIAGEPRLVLDRISQRAVDAIVVDLATHSDPAGLVHAMLERRPGTLVVITGKAPASVIGRAIAAGATTYLPKPYRPEELVATVRDLRGVALRATPEAPRAKRGSVIAVYGPKGGVGGTTVAISLAIALASRKKERVALVDLDLQFGDVGVSLDLKNPSSIADLLTVPNPIESGTLNDMFARHSSGIYALVAPPEPPDIGSIDVEAVIRLLEQLRGAFDYVVCDLWSSLEDLALATLRAADRVVLVTTPEVPALRHVRRVITATSPLLSVERTLVVANRAPSKSGLSVEEIERALGMPVAVAVPSDGAGITRAINEGMSIMDPRAGVRAARSFRTLAELVVHGLSERRDAHASRVPAAVPS